MGDGYFCMRQLHGVLFPTFILDVEILWFGKSKGEEGKRKAAGVRNCCRTVTQGQRDTKSSPNWRGQVGVLGSKLELDIRWNVLIRTQSQASSLLY